MKKLFRRTISAVTALSAVVSSLCISPAFAEVTPNPVISRNCPAYSGSGDAKSANDEHYFSFWFGQSPDYLAYDLSDVPDSEKESVIAVWYNASGGYDIVGSYASSNGKPSDYTIEVNKADGGEYPEDGWEVVEEVNENTLSSRQHVVNMKGYNWIRMNISKVDGDAQKTASINFDVHNVSDGISDSWLFLGDSITAGGMNNCYGTGFATHINQIDDRFFPIQENGGIGGIRSSDGREHIDEWLSVSNTKYVSIAYGTNDCWGNPNATQEYYENTKYMIDAVLAAGKIPILPKIPASTNTDVKDNVPLYNQMIDKLYNEYGSKIVQGVDFEEFFTEHPDYLSADGVHPNDTGYSEMRKIWAETMYKNVYSVINEQPEVDRFGDVDENGVIDMRDSVLISREYATISTGGDSILTEIQRTNADLDNDGRVDSIDALMIQIYYTERLNGETCSLRSYISKKYIYSEITDDNSDGAPYSNDPTGGFSETEIESSEYKPQFILSAEQNDDGIINLSVDISGSLQPWSTLGFTVDFDERLEPLYTKSGNLSIDTGIVSELFNVNAICSKDKNQIAVSAGCSNNNGIVGNIITIPFMIPEQADGENEYNFSISYKGGELFTDVDDSESARLMQAYLFTKGLASTSITVKTESSAVSEITGDANGDGIVTIADAAAIIQHLGNPDKYALSGQNLINADCYNTGDGVTALDALAIQKLEAKMIFTLPEMPEIPE